MQHKRAAGIMATGRHFIRMSFPGCKIINNFLHATMLQLFLAEDIEEQ